jgi:hypothetical protein
MLEFYVTGDRCPADGPDGLRFAGNLSLDDCRWLQRFGYVEEGTLSFFEDAWLPPAEVLDVLAFVIQKQEDSRSAPGFSCPAVDRLREILESAVREKSGLATYCD